MIARIAGNALRRVPRPIHRFRGCLRAQALRTHRHASTLVTIPPSSDDSELVSLFDQPQFDRPSRPLSLAGIFQHPQLTTPTAFSALADSTLVRAQLLTERILRARESRSELFKVVKNLDRLSDLLCGVIDLAELLRNAHPDSQWVQCANDSYEKLCEYMNVLNTHVGLYEVLRAVLHDAEIVESLSQEAYQTALIFWRDFEKSAIKLPPEQRERFVSLSSEILSLGHEFVTQASASRPPAIIEPSELDGLKDQGMGARLRRQAWSTQKNLLVYPGSHQAYMIMTSAPKESPRQKLYMAAHTSNERQIECLEQLLHARAELARLVGWDSYAGMTLNDKMAKTPENVSQFLDTFLDRTAVHARDALHTLRLRKQAHLRTPTLPIIQAWDRSYYCPPEPPEPPVPLPPLSLGRVFMGLSRLFKHLYGISLRPAEVASGEVWHSDVHKLEVVDEDFGVIGWIYADLFSRSGKSCGAAHYTVRCSRRTDDDDEAGDLVVGGNEEFLTPSRSFEAIKRHKLRGMDGEYQLPLVVLLCEFTRPTIARGPTVLEWHEVQTLFHEMGHAMHSMIGRTEYHNVAGTRCATDFVELPSILMEHFLNSPKVLSLFDTDGSSISNQTGNHHEDPCTFIDTHGSILLSVLDQIYHSPAVLKPGFDSTTTLANLYNIRGLIPHALGTSFQTQFSHLYGYGATYYSYLFDRAIASHVWRNIFSDEPLNRKLGEKYKTEVLRYGGGKDPWQMLGALLNAPRLQEGDEEAMREVGRWRVEEGPIPERH
ncbi:mitochondrial intermediate peptidase [Paxillus ammoniavirescens]|nr:mitochondrial intermediate peptidase [Paxillus ammoniavirescens]